MSRCLELLSHRTIRVAPLLRHLLHLLFCVCFLVGARELARTQRQTKTKASAAAAPSALGQCSAAPPSSTPGATAADTNVAAVVAVACCPHPYTSHPSTTSCVSACAVVGCVNVCAAAALIGTFGCVVLWSCCLLPLAAASLLSTAGCAVRCAPQFVVAAVSGALLVCLRLLRILAESIASDGPNRCRRIYAWALCALLFMCMLHPVLATHNAQGGIGGMAMAVGAALATTAAAAVTFYSDYGESDEGWQGVDNDGRGSGLGYGGESDEGYEAGHGSDLECDGSGCDGGSAEDCEWEPGSDDGCGSSGDGCSDAESDTDLGSDCSDELDSDDEYNDSAGAVASCVAWSELEKQEFGVEHNMPVVVGPDGKSYMGWQRLRVPVCAGGHRMPDARRQPAGNWPLTTDVGRLNALAREKQVPITYAAAAAQPDGEVVLQATLLKPFDCTVHLMDLRRVAGNPSDDDLVIMLQLHAFALQFASNRTSPDKGNVCHHLNLHGEEGSGVCAEAPDVAYLLTLWEIESTHTHPSAAQAERWAEFIRLCEAFAERCGPSAPEVVRAAVLAGAESLTAFIDTVKLAYAGSQSNEQDSPLSGHIERMYPGSDVAAPVAAGEKHAHAHGAALGVAGVSGVCQPHQRQKVVLRRAAGTSGMIFSRPGNSDDKYEVLMGELALLGMHGDAVGEVSTSTDSSMLVSSQRVLHQPGHIDPVTGDLLKAQHAIYSSVFDLCSVFTCEGFVPSLTVEHQRMLLEQHQAALEACKQAAAAAEAAGVSLQLSQPSNRVTSWSARRRYLATGPMWGTEGLVAAWKCHGLKPPRLPVHAAPEVYQAMMDTLDYADMGTALPAADAQALLVRATRTAYQNLKQRRDSGFVYSYARLVGSFGIEGLVLAAARGLQASKNSTGGGQSTSASSASNITKQQMLVLFGRREQRGLEISTAGELEAAWAWFERWLRVDNLGLIKDLPAALETWEQQPPADRTQSLLGVVRGAADTVMLRVRSLLPMSDAGRQASQAGMPTWPHFRRMGVLIGMTRRGKC